jgi:hypothetical protein
VSAIDKGRPPSRLLRRLPLLAVALVALIVGLWAGLLRMGVDVPALRPQLTALHGPLLVLGFLGTQIGLERAVALRRRWPYIAPTAAAAAAVWLIAGLPLAVGQLLLIVGGAALTGVFVLVHRIQPSRHNVVMGLGAAAWLVGAVVWPATDDIVKLVPWLVAFLVLTIVGERLELSRMVRVPKYAPLVLLVFVGVFVAGLALSMVWAGAGIRVAGVGLLGQALWLARYDAARRTIRLDGATRFMATALIVGYVWLMVAGVIWIAQGAMAGGGFAYDAMLHTIFVGFVFSMIFAHASIIIPAVLGIALPYHRRVYVALVLLQLGLVVRLVGDATGDLTAWRAGGVIDEAAILLFIALSAYSAITAKKPKRPAHAGRRATDVAAG